MAEEKRGRPTDFNQKYIEQVYKLCILGATDKDIADFFEVCEATINNWKQSHPEFLESLKRGKIEADMNVANSLYKRATGMTIVEEKETRRAMIQDGEELSCDILDTTTTKKELAPDPTSAFFWLKNRQPEKWRDKQEIDHTTGGEKVNFTPMQFVKSDKDK